LTVTKLEEILFIFFKSEVREPMFDIFLPSTWGAGVDLSTRKSREQWEITACKTVISPVLQVSLDPFKYQGRTFEVYILSHITACSCFYQLLSLFSGYEQNVERCTGANYSWQSTF